MVPTLIGLLRGFGRNVPGNSGVLLKLFYNEPEKPKITSNKRLSCKDLVTDSMKAVAGENVSKQKSKLMLSVL